MHTLLATKDIDVYKRQARNTRDNQSIVLIVARDK